MIKSTSETLFPVHTFKPRQPESSFDIHVYTPSDRAQRAAYPHRHNFNQIIFLTRGTGHHVVDFNTLPIVAPTLFFVMAGQIHFWQIDTPLQGYGVLFSSDVVSSTPVYSYNLMALFHSLSHTPLQLSEEKAQLLARIMGLYVTEVEGKSEDSVLSAYLHVMFVEIQRMCVSAKPTAEMSPTAELVRRYRQLVASHFRTHYPVAFYADQLGVSVAHLSKCVKEITGVSAARILREEILMEAKRLLFNTDMAVENISETLAFNDPAYFGRFFKREVGVTPRSFRSQTLQMYHFATD